jgi:hypothetical protein
LEDDDDDDVDDDSSLFKFVFTSRERLLYAPLSMFL